MLWHANSVGSHLLSTVMEDWKHRVRLLNNVAAVVAHGLERFLQALRIVRNFDAVLPRPSFSVAWLGSPCKFIEGVEKRPVRVFDAEVASVRSQVRTVELDKSAVDETEITLQMEVPPPCGSAHERALVSLLGPLRMHAAMGADQRLTQQIWMQLASFRDAFHQL